MNRRLKRFHFKNNKMEAPRRIQVCARIRPFLPREENQEDNTSALRVLDENHLILTPLTSRWRKLLPRYKFDRVWSPEATQEEVFAHLVPQLDRVLAGHFGSILTYGQTGTGKTHTVLGKDIWSLANHNTTRSTGSNNQQHADEKAKNAQPSSLSFSDWNTVRKEIGRGLIPRIFEYFLEKKAVKIRVGYLEIYNDHVFDLVPNDQNEFERREHLDIREHPSRGGAIVSGLSWHNITSCQELTTLLWTGAQSRAQRTTNMNEQSSRSHTILKLRLQLSNGLESQLQLVDLAGSEKYRDQMQNHTTRAESQLHFKVRFL